MVKNPPSEAGDMGSIPGQETKIPYAMGQLSPHAATTEPMCHNESSRMLQQISRMPQLRPNTAK